MRSTIDKVSICKYQRFSNAFKTVFFPFPNGTVYSKPWLSRVICCNCCRVIFLYLKYSFFIDALALPYCFSIFKWSKKKHDVFQPVEEADFEVINCLPVLNLIRNTKFHLSAESAFFCQTPVSGSFF